jgi:fibronectin-binding autotransporter adhesin
MTSLKTIGRLSVSLLFISAGMELARAQSTWSGAGTDQNWSTTGNWAGGAPGNTSTVTFPDGAFPLTTNVQGVVNNIVQSSTTIASLTYNNQSLNFDTTQIPAGTALTVSGNLSLGANDAASINTVVNFTGGGSLFAGTNGTSVLTGQNGSGQGSVSVLDMSGLANFSFNGGAASPGAINFGTGSSGSSITVSLASVSNLLTASTLNLGNNNTRGTVILNLGNGTNIIYADTINLAISKTSGTMQFLNNAGGGLTIANRTGTGRATIHLSGEASTGGTGTANVGNMLLNGGSVNIMASTLTVGDRGNRAASSPSTGAFGTLAFDNGVVDATTINMATNASGSTPATGTIAVSDTGVLKIGTGGMNMVDQLAAQPAIGTLVITNGGSVICSNNIYKGTSAGTANIAISDSRLTMASAAGTIGVFNSIPIDNFSITNAILNLPVGTSANVAVVNFNPDATTQNTINVPVLPSISSFPSQFPLITYQVASGNLGTLVLGTLPIGFGGYLSNNVTTLSIDIVITNGPVAKPDQWGGAVNTLWDTSTLNWTNAGAAVNYNDFDFVTFNDQASSSTVTVTGTRLPASLNVNNSVLNYTFNGTGKIGGAISLVKDGTATLTLSESGGDNFSGGITVNSGTVILDNTNSAISGGLTINGGATVQIGNNDAIGTLPAGTLSDEGTLVFKRSDNVQVGVNIPGGGGLTQSGSGRLALSAANAFTGNTTVTAGTLALTNAGAIANSAGVGVTNATLDLSGVTTSASLNALTLSNATLKLKVGYLQTNFTVGSVTMSGPSPNTINVISLPPIAFYPSTNVLLQSANPIVGNNLVLGSLPAGSVGTISLSADLTTVLLTLTSGPIGVRPTVTWAGTDALAGINTNWSDAQNWQSLGTPVSGERVVFNDNGTSGGSPFDVVGNGTGGVINPTFIDNIVDLNATNAGLNYANTGFHNTLIKPSDTLAVNGPLTVNGSGGTTTILGSGGTLVMGNPGNNSTLLVDAGGAPTLDLSGLDTFTGSVSQIGVGFNSGNTGSSVNGTLYLAKTNAITTGGGFSGVGSAIVVGGSTGTSAGAGTLYFGQTNALFVDGIVMGVSRSVGNVITFNPAVTNNNPKVVIRGITGPSSRVTQWSLGDATVNLNNAAQGNGHIVDFTGGTLDGLIGNLNVGQGSQGNTALANTSFSGMFNMGAGTLDVTSLKIGLSGGGAAGNGIGIMNVTGGNVVANTLALATTGGGQINTSGTLNLTNATLTVSNNVTIGAGTAGGTLSAVSSVIKLLNGANIGSPASPLTILNLDGGSVQVDVDAGAGVPKIAAATINTNVPTVINIHSFTNIGNDPIQIPLITYTTGNDPYGALTLGTIPPGYTIGNGGTLVDNAGALSIDVIVSSSTVVGPTTNASITKVTLSGTNLLVHGTNNNVPNTSFHYVVFSSTNVALPLSNWTPIVTNSFNPDGTFDYTNAIVPGISRQFIDVKAVP